MHDFIKLIFLFVLLTGCQEKRFYWVYLDDELNPTESLTSSTDQLMVRSFFDQQNIELTYYSHWLNAAHVCLSDHQMLYLSEHEYVKEVQHAAPMNLLSLDRKENSQQWSFALEQIDAQFIADEGLTGEGVKVGIIDGGFLKANKKPSLNHVFENSMVLGYIDFLTPDLERYGGSESADDGHGTDVWQQISGINNERNVQYGLAPNSSYYLARTDDGRKEYRGEEVYFVRALEWMYERGVRLVNISLGFSTGYDDEEENYIPVNMNGQFTAATRAANVGAEKGMLLVVSAGNDGANAFKVISAPADSKGVISVGSTGFKMWSKASFSSIGPETLGYLKPNVACFSFEGTSFSAPVITGLAACIMEKEPSMSNHQIKAVIEKSGHLYPYGNNYLGYGVPSASRILEQLRNGNTKSYDDNLIQTKNKKLRLKSDLKQGVAVIFHKSDSFNVMEQEVVKFSEFEIEVKRIPNANFSTIATPGFVREIQWL